MSQAETLDQPIGAALWSVEPDAGQVVLRLALALSEQRAILAGLAREFPAVLEAAEHLRMEPLRAFGERQHQHWLRSLLTEAPRA